MKNLSLFFLLFFLNYYALKAQCPPAGDLVFETQEEINAFYFTYPNCTKIEGNLTIEDKSDSVTNLNGLSNIKEIEGNFLVAETEILESLSGLVGLEKVGGYLKIVNNWGLKSVEGLIKLDSIGGDFWLIDNFSLERLEGLYQLQNIGGDCWIQYDNFLESVEELSELQSVGGDLTIGNVSEGLSFPSLAEIGGELRLEAIAVEDISDEMFVNLERVNTISICTHSATTTISGFNTIETLDGDVTIYGSICDESSLTTISGFSNLREIGGNLSFAMNNSLEKIDAFHALKTIGNYLYFQSNGLLWEVKGFDALEEIGGNVEVKWNFSLSDCCFVENLLAITEGDEPVILGNGLGCNDLEEIEESCKSGELTFDYETDVYPNITDDFFSIFITTNQTVEVDFRIYDVSARLFWEETILLETGRTAKEFDVSNFPKGLYFIETQANEQQQAHRLMVR